MLPKNLKIIPLFQGSLFLYFAGIHTAGIIDMWAPFALQRSIQFKAKPTIMQKLRQAVIRKEDRRVELPNYGRIRLL